MAVEEVDIFSLLLAKYPALTNSHCVAPKIFANFPCGQAVESVALVPLGIDETLAK